MFLRAAANFARMIWGDISRDTCCWCRTRGEMAPSGGGYWYCSPACEEAGGEYVNLNHPLREHPDAMADDGVHPNDAGHRLIADAVEDALAR